MDLRGVSMILGAAALIAAPVAWKYMDQMQAGGADVAGSDQAPAEPRPEPVRREMPGGAVFVSVGQ